MPDRYAPQMHFQNSTVHGEEHGVGTRHLRCSRLLQSLQRLRTARDSLRLSHGWTDFLRYAGDSPCLLLEQKAEATKSLSALFFPEMDLLLHAVCPNTAVTPQQGARLSSTKTKPRSLRDFCIVALSFYQRQSLS